MGHSGIADLIGGIVKSELIKSELIFGAENGFLDRVDRYLYSRGGPGRKREQLGPHPAGKV